MTTDLTPVRVLVSFTTADNADGWVTTLLNALKPLAESSGQSFDFVELPDSQIDAEDAEASFLLVVLSQAYVDAGLADSVVEHFRNSSPNGRLLVVEKGPLKQDDPAADSILPRPEPLRRVVGIPFHRQGFDNCDAFVMSDNEFFDRLLYLKDRLNEPTHPGSGDRPVVYLAEPPEHMRVEYMELRQKLEGAGDKAVRVVTPDERLSYLGPTDAASRFEADIKNCDVFAQLIDTRSIRGTGSFDDGYEDWLAKKAKAAGKPVVRWQPVERDSVFISYSKQDHEWRDKLDLHLKPFVKQQGLKVWTDKQIGTGDSWSDEIDNALRRTRVGVLLVSPNSIGSDFVMDEEYPRFKQAEKHDDLSLFWLLISPAAYSAYGVDSVQAAHDIKQPLSSMELGEVDAVLAKVAEKINIKGQQPIKRGFSGGEVLNGDLHEFASHVQTSAQQQREKSQLTTKLESSGEYRPAKVKTATEVLLRTHPDEPGSADDLLDPIWNANRGLKVVHEMSLEDAIKAKRYAVAVLVYGNCKDGWVCEELGKADEIAREQGVQIIVYKKVPPPDQKPLRTRLDGMQIVDEQKEQEPIEKLLSAIEGGAQ